MVQAGPSSGLGAAILQRCVAAHPTAVVMQIYVGDQTGSSTPKSGFAGGMTPMDLKLV